jgi:alpha-D-xyloside xylohydrolase
MWLSRAYYRTPQEAIDTAAELRRRAIPCDVITLDGRAAWEVRTRFAFEWDRSRFDDPRRILTSLKAFDLKVCVWEYPCISIHNPLFQELADKGWLLKRADGSAYVFDWVKDPTDDPFGKVLTPLPHSGLLDFTHPEAARYWADRHDRLFDDGVDVFKTDFGEQVEDDMRAHNGDSGRRLHNVYPLLYNACVYGATQRYNDRNGRGAAMVWGRDGFIGSQRYPMQWGGDSQSDWEGMAAGIRAGLGYGMSGVPYYATDVGGFYGAEQPDSELYLRWTSNAIFCSHFRYHGIGLREPWALGKNTEAVAKKLLAFRYRLIPYIAGAAQQASQSGLPLMRAMPLAFPHDRAARAFEGQYLFGDALLVAPITRPGGAVEVYFPKGEIWHDPYSGERIEGGQVRRVHREIDQLPMWGREGYALCLGKAVLHTGEIDLEAPIEEVHLFGMPVHQPCTIDRNIRLIEREKGAHLTGVSAAMCRPSSGLHIQDESGGVDIEVA